MLTHNDRFFSEAVGSDEREHWGQIVLEKDSQYLSERPNSSLFAYVTAQPNKRILESQEILESWEAEENRREAQATENGGRYYEASMLNEVYWALAVQDRAARDLYQEVQTIRSSYLYSHLTRMLESNLCRRALQSRLVRSLRKGSASA